MITAVSNFNQNTAFINSSKGKQPSSLLLKGSSSIAKPLNFGSSSFFEEATPGIALGAGLLGAVCAFSYSIIEVAPDLNPRNILINGLFALGGLIGGCFTGGTLGITGMTITSLFKKAKAVK